ncbi:MAG TPA: N-acetyl sugar amidotransferase [Chitinophagaceae bacterium]|nr:N-acetyl sugar amidotransferase [Chitinophagaceae bacterium]
MTPRPYQQCQRCVMDTSDPYISFDKNGICNHCSEYFMNVNVLVERTRQENERLQRLTARIKRSGKGKKFDCILGLSGGVDSCYTALLLKDLGLRVLAVHMDNGWDADSSVRNINSVIDKLELNYQSYVLDWEEFKDLQLAFLKASVPELETPTDMAIPACLHKIAAAYRIKYIISGGNVQTEGILPKSWHYDAKDLVYLKSIHKRYGSGKLRNYPLFGYPQEFYYKYYHGIKTIYLLNHANYNKKDAMATLKEKIDWKDPGGKHFESLYTRFVQSYILPEKFNIDYRRATFSTQICAGELCRDYALEKLKELPYDPQTVQKEKEYISKKLGITTAEFEHMMRAPVKSYRDYPNNKRSLESIYKLYRKFNKPPVLVTLSSFSGLRG